jgi:hypothetical protein
MKDEEIKREVGHPKPIFDTVKSLLCLTSVNRSVRRLTIPGSVENRFVG